MLQVLLSMHLIVEIDIHIFTESVALGESGGTVLHKVESFQGAKRCQQLLNLKQWQRSARQLSRFKFAEMTGGATNKCKQT